MTNYIAALGALVLYGSYSIALPVGAIREDQLHPSLTGVQSDEIDLAPLGDAVAAAVSSTERPTTAQKISEEERERRVQVCERRLAACGALCTNPKEYRTCHSRCMAKMAECMKNIPYAE